MGDPGVVGESREGGDSPLSAEQTRQVVEADRARAKFQFAAKVAGFNGWTMAGCAILCLPFVVLSPWSAVIAAALAGAAYAELRGRDRLRALDPAGARVLTRNQLAVLLGIYVYCGASLYAGLNGPPLSAQLREDPSLTAVIDATGDSSVLDMVGEMDEMARTLTIVAYVAVAVTSTLVLGGLFVFYRARGRALADYLASTPAWILDLQRARR